MKLVQKVGLGMVVLTIAIWLISDNGSFPIFRPILTPTPKHDEANFQPMEKPSSPTWDEMDSINKRLDRHDHTVLSMIPAKGYRDGLAGVLRGHKMYVNVNSEIYFRGTPVPEKNLPVGYYVSLYICRLHKSNKYDDLDGVHGLWFRPKNQSSFVPWNAWAQHISDHDSWIEVGGPFDQMDSAQRAKGVKSSGLSADEARATVHTVFGR